MKELALILSAIRFIIARLDAIADRVEKRYAKERQQYEAMKARFEQKASELEAAQKQAAIVKGNINRLLEEA